MSQGAILVSRCIYVTREPTPADTISCIETDISYSSVPSNMGHNDRINPTFPTMNPAHPSNNTSPGALPNGQPSTMELAVVGAHLSGFPLNRDLTTIDATLHQITTTSPKYRLYKLASTVPAKPGLVRDTTGQGRPIEIEVWSIPATNVGAFLSTIPSPLGLGSVELEDGRWVRGFICEPYGLEGARDVSEFRGWRNYRASCG